MPSVDPAQNVLQIFNKAFSNGIFSQREAKRALTSIKKDGVTDADVAAVVAAFREALDSTDGDPTLDITSSGRRARANRFLNSVHKIAPLPVDIDGADRAPSGGVDFITLLSTKAAPGQFHLPKLTFGRQTITLEKDGNVLLGGTKVDLNMASGAADVLEAMQGLLRKGQLTNVPEGTKRAFCEQLQGYIEDSFDVAQESPKKFNRFATTTAAIGALAAMSDAWSESTKDVCLTWGGKVGNASAQAYLWRGLSTATLNDAQRANFAQFDKPEAADDLLEVLDAIADGSKTLNGSRLPDRAASVAFAALSFASDANACENLFEGLSDWSQLNGSRWDGFDDDEVDALTPQLTGYIEAYPHVAFAFGSFAADAARDVGSVRNERLVASLRPGLEGPEPSLDGYPLTVPQAIVMLDVIAVARDESSIRELKYALNNAQSAFGGPVPSGNRSDQSATTAPTAAAFALFERAVVPYCKKAAGHREGKLRFTSFVDSFSDRVDDLRALIKPLFEDLTSDAPHWGEVPVSAEAAAYIRGIVENHTRSSMSIRNLNFALAAVAEAHNGAIDTTGLAQFEKIVTNYMAQWPSTQFFDFNKLERIAKATVNNQPLPAFTVNGATVGLANFYDAVAKRVTASVDRTSHNDAWMADRYGFRSKQAIEILDVLAELAARGEGPIAVLQEQFPGLDVGVEFSGGDGGHQQFLFTIKRGERILAKFNQGSDGELAEYTKRIEKRVFSADISVSGDLHVHVPNPIDGYDYLLQRDYGVGDSVDVLYIDSKAKDRAKEGEKFETRSKILQAEIVSYSVDGKYTVSFESPEGKATERTLSLYELQSVNNPHYFDIGSSGFSDVSIDIDSDPALKDLIDGAKPIIDAYLPTDGSLATLSVSELSERQEACVTALMDYGDKNMSYPSGDSDYADAQSKEYHEIINNLDRWGRVSLGKLLAIDRGVCRHQCIVQQLLLQTAGIDSRLASGAANTSSGKFRGYHIWVELTLANGKRFLSDQTWKDELIPLWDGAYDVDKRRVEMGYRTSRYKGNVVRPA